VWGEAWITRLRIIKPGAKAGESFHIECNLQTMVPPTDLAAQLIVKITF
jgi:hypothetical protein